LSAAVAGDELPRPPRRLPDPGFDLDLINGLMLWRLHREANPLRPGSHPTGKFRFDAPRNGAEYRVTYGSDDEYGPFGEVYGDTQLIGPSERTRRYSRIEAGRPLNLIPLDDATVQKTLKLDGRIAMSKQYGKTMLWSRALHRWFPIADGIRYPSRHASPARNYCLFLDRCRHDLSVTEIGLVGDLVLRPTVLEAADRYRLAVMIPRPRP
jgi:uncharacterized protein YbaR (Trm112 family)